VNIAESRTKQNKTHGSIGNVGLSHKRKSWADARYSRNNMMMITTTPKMISRRPSLFNLKTVSVSEAKARSPVEPERSLTITKEVVIHPTVYLVPPEGEFHPTAPGVECMYADRWIR
jgi:hypothetical protein